MRSGQKYSGCKPGGFGAIQFQTRLSRPARQLPSFTAVVSVALGILLVLSGCVAAEDAAPAVNSTTIVAAPANATADSPLPAAAESPAASPAPAATEAAVPLHEANNTTRELEKEEHAASEPEHLPPADHTPSEGDAAEPYGTINDDEFQDVEIAAFQPSHFLTFVLQQRSEERFYVESATETGSFKQKVTGNFFVTNGGDLLVDFQVMDWDCTRSGGRGLTQLLRTVC